MDLSSRGDLKKTKECEAMVGHALQKDRLHESELLQEKALLDV